MSALLALVRQHGLDLVDSVDGYQRPMRSAVAGLTAHLPPALFLAASRTRLTGQSVRGRRLGRVGGILLPQRQFPLQIGDLLFGVRDLLLGVCDLLLFLGQLLSLFGELLPQLLHLAAQAFVLATQCLSIQRRRPFGARSSMRGSQRLLTFILPNVSGHVHWFPCLDRQPYLNCYDEHDYFEFFPLQGVYPHIRVSQP